MTDDLTGLSNLRSFEERLLTLVRASRDEGSGLALLVLDLDRLKALNDAHGHLAGAVQVYAPSVTDCRLRACECRSVP